MSSISRWYCSASRDERLKSRFVAINKPLCSIPNESKYNGLYHIIKSKVHEVRGIFLFFQLRRLYQQFVQVAIGFRNDLGLMRSNQERETRPSKQLQDACCCSACEPQWWKIQRDEAN